MTFASVTFLIFFALVLLGLWLLWYVLPLHGDLRRSISHVFLWGASYLFYGWWNLRLLVLLLGVTLVAFCTAGPCEEERKLLSRVRFGVGVAIPLAALGLFKYFDFFVDSFCQVFGVKQSPGLSLTLPVGISFYTFQALSYTIDVYRGRIKRETSFVRFALYISFFPQLVAGPIVRAADFLPQLMQDRKPTLHRLETGLQIFVFGMAKKLVLADNLSVFVDEVYRTPQMFHWTTVALAVVSYAIQIYMDFSGYSDMAIGCAHCMGYDLNRNFNLPYCSKNVSEFWKRWHISLSGWLQQYLYFSLGGNRRGRVRTYLNLMITMLLGGLWHGAGWTFVLWGGLHGVALCIHKAYLKRTGVGKNGAEHRAMRILCVVVTDLFVCLCWVFFRAESTTQALAVLKQLFGLKDGVVNLYSWSIVAIAVTAVATAFAYARAVRKKTSDRQPVEIEGYYPVLNLSRFWSLVVFFVAIGGILGLAYVGGNPFIYFQF